MQTHLWVVLLIIAFVCCKRTDIPCAASVQVWHSQAIVRKDFPFEAVSWKLNQMGNRNDISHFDKHT